MSCTNNTLVEMRMKLISTAYWSILSRQHFMNESLQITSAWWFQYLNYS